MRLAAKLVLLFLVGMLLIVAVFSYLTIQLDRRLAVSEHQRHAAELADALQRSARIEDDPNPAGKLQEQFGSSVLHFQKTTIRMVMVGSNDEAYRPSVPPGMIIQTQKITTVRVPERAGPDRLVTLVPVGNQANNGSERQHLEISSPDPGAEDRVRRSVISSLVALLGVATLSGLVVVVGGVKMVGKPLNTLIDKVHRAGQGDFSDPVQLKSGDELGRLGVAINEMCEQLEHQRMDLEAETASRIEAVDQLRHAERLNMVGRMAAGLAHEIGTPLNVVSGRAELIAGGQLSDEATRESAKAIHSEAKRIAAIVRHLLDFARQSTPQRSRQNLNDLISLTVSLMEPLAARNHTNIDVRLCKPDLTIEADPAQIQQVLTNLVVNAVQSARQPGQVTIALDTVDRVPPSEPRRKQGEPQQPITREPTNREPGSKARFCRVTVTDNGEGIATEDLQHIFEPFFTTKDVGEGTGLGLSITHGIVQEHDGWIDVESEHGKGSSFKVYLPAADESSQQDNDRESHDGE